MKTQLFFYIMIALFCTLSLTAQNNSRSGENSSGVNPMPPYKLAAWLSDQTYSIEVPVASVLNRLENRNIYIKSMEKHRGTYYHLLKLNDRITVKTALRPKRGEDGSTFIIKKVYVQDTRLTERQIDASVNRLIARVIN